MEYPNWKIEQDRDIESVKRVAENIEIVLARVALRQEENEQ